MRPSRSASGCVRAFPALFGKRDICFWRAFGRSLDTNTAMYYYKYIIHDKRAKENRARPQSHRVFYIYMYT